LFIYEPDALRFMRCRCLRYFDAPPAPFRCRRCFHYAVRVLFATADCTPAHYAIVSRYAIFFMLLPLRAFRATRHADMPLAFIDALFQPSD